MSGDLKRVRVRWAQEAEMADGGARDREFTAFMAAATGTLSRTALLLTGDADAAADLLRASLVKTYLAWPQVGPQGALAHARRVMVNHDLNRRGVPLSDVAADEAAPVPGTDPTQPIEVALDSEAVLDEAREAVRNRRMGWTVAGWAVLAVVASILTPILIAQTVPSPAPPEPVATRPSTANSAPASSATAPAPREVDGRLWHLSSATGSWRAEEAGITLLIQGEVVSGWSGCGDYSGQLTRDGANWRVSGLKITEPVPCPSAGSDSMNAFFHDFGNTVSAEHPTTDTLRLHTANGDLVFTAS